MGGASKSEGDNGGEWKWPYRDDSSSGRIFFLYSFASPCKMYSLSKSAKSVSNLVVSCPIPVGSSRGSGPTGGTSGSS